jgi:hypothetical protein
MFHLFWTYSEYDSYLSSSMLTARNLGLSTFLQSIIRSECIDFRERKTTGLNDFSFSYMVLEFLLC